jgi:hypothetical protein
MGWSFRRDSPVEHDRLRGSTGNHEAHSDDRTKRPNLEQRDRSSVGRFAALPALARSNAFAAAQSGYDLQHQPRVNGTLPIAAGEGHEAPDLDAAGTELF